MSEQGPADLRHVVVVVPAQNEEHVLARCLDRIRDAAALIDVPVTVAVTLDRCTDGTGELVQGRDLTVVETTAGSVGVARELGVRAALDAIPRTVGREDIWIANTDADSEPDRRWLGAQLEHARAGAELVVGLVEIDEWQDWPSQLRESYRLAYLSGIGSGRHTHIHGASLGIRADCYLRVGGFAPLQTGEDVDLVRRCVEAGMAVTWALDVSVSTSARAHGRAPDGLARYLSMLSGAISASPAES